MSSIDLLVVTTLQKKVFCYAPYGIVKVGDKVITRNGSGTVTDSIYTLSEDDVFKFFKRNMSIEPIEAVIRPVNFERGNYDIST